MKLIVAIIYLITEILVPLKSISNPVEFINSYKHKIWSWHEFQDSFAHFPNLQPYMQDTFKDYAWCIRMKV